MSEFKGTPGPWEITDVLSQPFYRTGSIAIGKEGNKWIAEAKGLHVLQGNPDEIKANAHLIAAAPELIEALQSAKQVIQSLKLCMLVHPDCTEGSEFDDYTSDAQEIEDDIELVINKALGLEVSHA